MPRVSIPAIGSVGVNRDTQPHELPISALSEVRNIRMRDGSAERIAGDVPVLKTPTVTPYWLQIYKPLGANFVVHAGLAEVHANQADALTNITGTNTLTGTDADRWTGGVLNGVLVLNNGVNPPMYWGGNIATPLAVLTGWNSNWRCLALRPFKNYLIGLNWVKSGTNYPNMVKWSAAADPGTVPATWNEADPTNDAGEIDLSETSGVVVDGLPLGDSFIIYKSDSMYAMTYIGGQYIWQFRRLPGDVGILARGCVCNTPVGHLVLTLGDAVVHNGSGLQSILSGKVRRHLFASMDGQFADRSFVLSNPATNEAWICYPETGSQVCTKALIWNWVDGTFTFRDLSGVTCGTSGQYESNGQSPWSADGATWADDDTSWDMDYLPATQSRFILGTNTPQLLGVDVGTQFHGSTFPATVERTGLAFDDLESVKTCKAIYPRIDGTTGETVYVQAGGAMDVEGPYNWSDPVPYVIGSTYRADLFASGRFLAYRVYSTAALSWRIRSLDMEVQAMGRY